MRERSWRNESSEATFAEPPVPLTEDGGRWRQPCDRVPTLTVLCHPDPDRVGDTSAADELQDGRSLLVSRLKPEFRRPGEPAGQPLGDRSLSRTPLRLSPSGLPGTVRLDPGESPLPVTVNGVPLTAARDFGPADLEQGIVLQLSSRIVVLLHLASAGAPPAGLFPALVGASDLMARLRSAIRSVADLDVPVLLRGETGTGKELVAQAIHQASRRRGAPFLTVNMGAVPSSLAVSELFGAVRGAYTGAVRDQTGVFQRADGGTLFLDEVGETPADVQVMLLRVLETGEIQRLGGPGRRVDVRLIAATDVDLEAAVADDRFRGPLLHRLSGYEIPVPPLRERREDFGRLLFHFLREELRALGQEERLRQDEDDGPLWLPAAIVARLARHPWPGNVRQLRNVARELAIGSRTSGTAQVGPQMERLLREITGAAQPPPGPARRRSAPGTFRSPSEVTREEVLEALRANRFELKNAAESLGISRPALYLLLEKLPDIRTARDLGRNEILEARETCGDNLEALASHLEVSRKGLQQRMKELGLT